MKSLQKLKTKEEITKIAENLRENNKSIVTTNGSFDILHYAHLDILEKAKNEADILIVLLNSDASIKRFKGETRPIIPEKERAAMLSALTSVDYIVIFNEDKPLGLLKSIKPNLHVKGGTFIEERVKEEKELLESWGGKFKNFELEEGFSTTNIINSILEKHK